MAKALSLLQPFAELVVIRSKHFETRSWPTKYRGELYIHASAKFHSEYLELCYRDEHFKREIPNPHSLQVGKIIGKCWVDGCYPVEEVRDNLVGSPELSFGDYSDGRWAWMLTHAEKFKQPIPYKGSLSIWDFDSSLLPFPL